MGLVALVLSQFPFNSSVRVSLIALFSASAMAISFVNCIFLISLSRSKNVISVFSLAVLAAASNLSERPELALEFTDVLLIEVFVRLEFPDFIEPACD